MKSYILKLIIIGGCIFSVMTLQGCEKNKEARNNSSISNNTEVSNSANSSNCDENNNKDVKRDNDSSKSNDVSNGNELVKPKNPRDKYDIQVIDQLKKAGSDLSKEHEIEHHFVIYGDKKKADGAISELVKQNYKVTELEEDQDNGESYYFFDAIISSMVKPEIISSQTYTMEKIADKYDIEYDDWGCMVVK